MKHCVFTILLCALLGCGTNSDGSPAPTPADPPPVADGGSSGPFQCPDEITEALTAPELDLAVNETFALPAPPGQPSLESICGASTDFQDVELYDGTLGVSQAYVQTHEPGALQFQWLSTAQINDRLPGHSAGNVGEARWCTGTLIAADRALTAAHCFDTNAGGWQLPSHPATGVPAPEVLATLQVANFNYQINAATGTTRTPDRFPISRLVEFGFPGLDYAIVELGRDSQGRLPGDVYPIAEIRATDGVRCESIAILQHPSGLPKKIEAGTVLRLDGQSVLYRDIDTLGGSSGSGVRDLAGRVVGVHTNGGCQFDANRGVTISAIAAVSSEI